MGQQRDARIRDWQRRAGLEPARGEYAVMLQRMSQLARELIEVLALERAGIRDGDGQWSAGDPIAGIVVELNQLAVDSEQVRIRAMLELGPQGSYFLLGDALRRLRLHETVTVELDEAVPPEAEVIRDQSRFCF
jgi:hypothetical protein